MAVSWRPMERTIWVATDAAGPALAIISERQRGFVLIAASGSEIGTYTTITAAQNAFEAASKEKNNEHVV